MKILLISTLCFTLAISAPQAKIKTEEQQIAELLSLYDIDFETNNGRVEGVRLRRSGEAALFDPLPEIDIRKVNDQTYEVNGVRVKRGDVSKLSDVDLEKEVEADAQANESEAEERSRRSGGSGGILELLSSKITSKISSLFGASSGSSGHAEPDTHYGPPVVQSYDQKSFDVWQFKKAILSHLFQAVKAIKGGIIALGGQLVKVKGSLITTAGKIVSHKGEAISGFGRHIASSALLPAHPVTAPGTSYGPVDPVPHVPDTGYGYPDSSYGPPSYNPPPSSSYLPHGYNKRGAGHDNFAAPHHELPQGMQAGLLVLKPINGGSSSQHFSSFIDPRHKGFSSKDSIGSASETFPQRVQSRSYFIAY